MQTATLTWELRVKDMASAAFKGMGQSAKAGVDQARTAIDKLKDGLKALPGRVLKAAASFLKLAAAGVGITGVVTAVQGLFRSIRRGLSDAVKFSKAMVEVSTISEEVNSDLGYVTQQVLDLSTAFGIVETTASKALYQTISAGVTDASEAMTLLENAAILSVGGLATLNSTVDVLTDTINAYGFDVSEVTHINNVFFETVRLGKTTVQELAEGLGVVTPVAAELGVSLEELSAMLATLTKGGIDNTTAIIYMRQALVSVLKPSSDAQELIEQLGLEFNVAKIKSDGFIGLLDDLRQKVGDDVYALQTLFPNVRALVPVMALAGSRFEEFNEILSQISDTALDAAAPAMRAFERVMLSSGQKFEVLTNALRQGVMEIATAFLEGLTGPIDSLEGLQGAAQALRDGLGNLGPVMNMFAGAMLMLIATIPELVSMFASLAGTMGQPAIRASLEETAESMDLVGDVAREMGASLMFGGGDAMVALEKISLVMARAPRKMARDIEAAMKEVERLSELPLAIDDHKLRAEFLEAERTLEVLLERFKLKFGRSYAGLQEEIAVGMTVDDLQGLIADRVLEGFQTLNLQRAIDAAVDAQQVSLGVPDIDLKDLKRELGDDFLEVATVVYKTLGYQVDEMVAEGLLSERATNNLRSRVNSVQKILLQLGGDELKQALGVATDDLGGGAVGFEIDEEALGRYKSALAGIEFQLDVLDAASRDSFEAQREGIELATEAALAELEVQRESREITLEQYEQMYAAILEGNANQLLAVEQAVQREMEQREEAAQRAVEAEERKAQAAERAALRALNASRQFVESGSLATAQALSMNDAITMGAEELSMLLVNAQAQLDAASMMMQDMGGNEEVSVYNQQEIEELQQKINLLKEEAMARAQVNDRIKDYITAGGKGSQVGNSFRASMQQLTTQFSDFGKMAGDLVANQLQALTGGLADMFVGVMDGSKDSSEAWEEFALTFVKGLVSMTLQMLMMYGVSLMLQALGIPVGVMMGGGQAAGVAAQANGGVNVGGLGDLVPVKGFATGGVAQQGLGRLMPVKGYATGGPIVNEPHVALIGEGDHNEAVVPLPDGRSIPVQMMGGGQEGPVNVNFQIQAFDSKDVTRVIQGQEDQIKGMIMQAVMEDRGFRRRMG